MDSITINHAIKRKLKNLVLRRIKDQLCWKDLHRKWKNYLEKLIRMRRKIEVRN